MARIAGVDLPRNKHANIALTYIYGIGNSRAARILDAAKVDPMKKVSDLGEDEVNRIRDTFAACFDDDVDGALASKIIAALSALLRDAIFNSYGDSKPLDVWDELARFHRIVLAEMIAARWKEEEASRPLEKDVRKS